MAATLKVCPQCGNEYELDVRFCPRDGAILRAPAGAQNDLVGTIIADRYSVLKKLGEGGMGQVYMAEHVRMKRKSAIKVMAPAMVQDPDAIARFNREAENASQISHPNVAAIYDFGETADGLVYLAMEFIDGDPLTKLIKRLQIVPAARTADIIKQAADGLGAAHDLGIVHRDLKPDNIMIAKGRENSDIVKIVDFGIAKAVGGGGQNVTRTGLAIGTPEYMSPEQLAGDKLDHRTDIYSLGLVAFNMLTGMLPFPATSSKEAMIMRLTDRPRTLAEMKHDVIWPDELQRVLDRALANEVNDRYQRIAEFGREFAIAVQNMPETVVAGQGTAIIDANEIAAARSGAISSVNRTVQTGASAAVTGAATAQVPTAPTGARTAPVPAVSAPQPAAPTPVVPPPAVAAPPAKSGGKGGLIAAAVLIPVLAAGGWFAMNRSKPAPAPAVDTTVATAPTTPVSTAAAPSIAPPATDTHTVAAVPANTTAVTPAVTAPTPTPTPAASTAEKKTMPAGAFGPVDAFVSKAADQKKNEDYDLADDSYKSALSALSSLRSSYAGSRSAIDAKIKSVSALRTKNRSFCQSELAAAKKRGETVDFICPSK